MVQIELKNRKLDNLIRQKVIETIQEIFNDPDYGLPLAQKTIQRLKKSMRSKKAGRVISLEKILKKYSK